MLRATALLVGLAGFLPVAAAGQHHARWFFDTGIGASWPAAYAFDRGGSARIGVGVEVTPSLHLSLSGAAERLPYSDERFQDLFVIEEGQVSDAGDLAAEVLSVSGRLEWSPMEWGSVAPLIGIALGVQKRSASGLIGSPAWARCSTATRFVFSTDPETGRTTLSMHDPTPEPGCEELRKDIRVDGTSLGLTSSVGVHWRMERDAVLAVIRFSPNLLPASPILSTDITWRRYF